MAQHRIAVVVPQDFALFEVGVALDLFAFRGPGTPDTWYDVRACAASRGASTTMSGGFLSAVIPHGVEAIEEADTVVVLGSPTTPVDPVVTTAIRRAYRRGARMVSFCTGTFALAASGILDGHTVTTHWRHAAQLARAYPRVRVQHDVLYVDDGQVLSSAGNAAGVDLALHIIRNDHGAGMAREVARDMVLAPHREGGQAQFITRPVLEFGTTMSGIHRAIEYVSLNLDQDITLDGMAELAYMSTRNFSRRFREVTGTTPNKWLLQHRLTRARELLEETDEPIDRVAHLAGFGSAVTMRQRFAAAFRTSPVAYRRQFRRAAPAVTPTRIHAANVGGLAS